MQKLNANRLISKLLSLVLLEWKCTISTTHLIVIGMCVQCNVHYAGGGG